MYTWPTPLLLVCDMIILFIISVCCCIMGYIPFNRTLARKGMKAQLITPVIAAGTVLFGHSQTSLPGIFSKVEQCLLDISLASLSLTQQLYNKARKFFRSFSVYSNEFRIQIISLSTIHLRIVGFVIHGADWSEGWVRYFE